jgi:hypothetical protein
MTPGYQGTRGSAAAASATGDQPAAHDADARFLEALEAATLPPDQFDHASHVRAGYLYLRSAAFPQATAAMCDTIERYSRAIGKPGRYHETITVAFMALINERMRRDGDRGGWPQFCAANPQLFMPDALLAYYPREVLESAQARSSFTLMRLAL